MYIFCATCPRCNWHSVKLPIVILNREIAHFLDGLAVGGGGVNLRAEVGGGGSSSVEVLGEDWLKEGAEDELGSTGLWKSEPEGEEELEGVVEWEPVDGVDEGLENGKEAEYDPILELGLVKPFPEDKGKTYGQPLGIINLAGREEGVQRVVCWDDERSEIGEESSTEVEEDEEEVESHNTEDRVDLWNRGLLLEVIEDRVARELKKG